MQEIIIKITIPESEYKQWSEFEISIETLKKSIRRDFEDTCFKLGILKYDVDVSINDIT